jgi:hypothetical protein
MTPTGLTYGRLSAPEATEWLRSVAVNRQYRGEDWQGWLSEPLTWLTRHCPIGGFVPRTRLMANWLVAKKGWAGWSRQLPVGYGADGQMRHITPQDMLDEIQDVDLPQGQKTNPERVFRAVLARTSQDALAGIAEKNAPFPLMPWTTIPNITQITCARDLVAEGIRMQHCVGGYSDMCRNGGHFILRLPNSTAEINRLGDVYQHRARQNADPSPQDKALLARWVATRKPIKK